MSSQNFLDKLNDTRLAIRAVVDAIMAAYYSKSEVDGLLAAHDRFIRLNTGTTLSGSVRLIPDNGAGVCTYTLPANPPDGTVVEWRPSSTAFSTNAMVFLRNGKTIMSQNNDLTIDTDGLCGRLVWSQADSTWWVDQLGTALGV